MFEKVNPSHPDKIADRIAGAIVDLAYKQSEFPRIAVEVLIGHGKCHIISESSVNIDEDDVKDAVRRIAGPFIVTNFKPYAQDEHLALNQIEGLRCGDNGIFKGMPVTEEQIKLAEISGEIYDRYRSDGKYILNGDRLIICQSNTNDNGEYLKTRYYHMLPEVNPLGEWTGGTSVDTGATNRKLGSDMGDSVTGGGLHGKDLSKADVSVNIYCWLKAQRTGKPVEMCCAIGDEYVDDIPYQRIVKIAGDYINRIGGFEKFAEWGLICRRI